MSIRTDNFPRKFDKPQKQKLAALEAVGNRNKSPRIVGARSKWPFVPKSDPLDMMSQADNFLDNSTKNKKWEYKYNELELVGNRTEFNPPTPHTRPHRWR